MMIALKDGYLLLNYGYEVKAMRGPTVFDDCRDPFFFVQF